MRVSETPTALARRIDNFACALVEMATFDLDPERPLGEAIVAERDKIIDEVRKLMAADLMHPDLIATVHAHDYL
jgi:hypothetical protein